VFAAEGLEAVYFAASDSQVVEQLVCWVTQFTPAEEFAELALLAALRILAQ
jgi:hypothetical protein